METPYTGPSTEVEVWLLSRTRDERLASYSQLPTAAAFALDRRDACAELIRLSGVSEQLLADLGYDVATLDDPVALCGVLQDVTNDPFEAVIYETEYRFARGLLRN